MAKKSDRPKGKPGPKPDPSRVRTSVTMVRSMPEWKTWVEELAAHDRASSLGDLLDHALVSYAREIKFPKPAPRR
jgi:hypothetical protein